METILHDQDLLNELTTFSSSCISIGIVDPKCAEAELVQIVAKIRQAWNFAAFSHAAENTLNRYFTYQAKFMAAFLNSDGDRQLFSDKCQRTQSFLLEIRSQICALIDHLDHYFGKYVDLKIALPSAYRLHFINQFGDSCRSVCLFIDSEGIEEKLRNCLKPYISKMIADQDFQVDFLQLYYFRKVVNELTGLGKTGREINVSSLVYDKLIELNFNHMDVFAYHQQVIRSSLNGKKRIKKHKCIQEKLVAFDNYIADAGDSYDPKMRSLSIMLSGWLREELACLTQEEIKHQQNIPYQSLRLQLQLSISHISFLIRLFYKQNLFGSIPLNDIFVFFAANFSSKRQERMSPGGISKEYYTKNIVTAAEIKALLLKMIAQINLDYFPVMAVISAVIFCR